MTEQNDQPTAAPEQPPAEPAQAEIDLNAFLHEQEQYARDINAEFEAKGVSVDSPEWTQWCDELAEWNAALATAVTEESTE